MNGPKPEITNMEAFRFFLLVTETMRAHRRLANGGMNRKQVEHCDRSLIAYINTTLQRMRAIGFQEVPDDIV